MTILWITIFVAVVCIVVALQHYIKNYVFNRSNIFTPKTSRLFRKTGVIYIECLRLYGYYFEKPPLFLIDTGATTNFIRQDVLDTVYPQYQQHVQYGDDIMSVNGTMTLNRIVDVPVHFKPTLSCKIPFTLLTQTDSLDYLSGECNEQIIGIIGTEFLKDHGIDINFKLL